MALDFFGVRLSGRIRQFPKGGGGGDQGRVIELWTEPQDSELTKDLGALAFVSQVNIEYRLGQNVTLAMVLTPPFEDALKFLQSELVRFGVGRLEVEIGYTTGTSSGPGATTFTSLPFSGFLQVPTVSIGQDITITLNALGVGYQMNLVGGAETKSYETNTTPAQAVEQTLRKYIQEDGASSGLVIKNLYEYVPKEKQDPNSGDDFFRVPAAKTVADKPAKSGADVPVGVLNKGPRNDWWFIREVTEAYGYDIIIWGNEIYIVEKTEYFRLSFGGARRKHFLLRGITDPERNMFPILSFSTPTEGAWLSPGVGKLVMLDIPKNKDQKDPVEHEASGKKTEVSRGKGGAVGENVPVENKSDDGTQAAAPMSGDPENPRDRKKAEAHWKDKQMSDGIHGVFTTIGIPNLMPGESVQVHGFEPFGSNDPERALFNGVYGVQMVRHSVGVGGWQTNFEGVLGYFSQEAMQKRTAELNAKKQKEAQNQEIPKDQSDSVKRQPKRNKR